MSRSRKASTNKGPTEVGPRDDSARPAASGRAAVSNAAARAAPTMQSAQPSASAPVSPSAASARIEWDNIPGGPLPAAAPRLATSLRDLARQVGRSHTAVQDWVRHPEWNQPRNPPWNVEQARAWAASTLSPNPAEAWSQSQTDTSSGLDALRRQPLQAAKLKLTLTRAAKLELERALLAGDLVDRREVEEGLVRRVHAARGALQSLPRELAAELVGQDEIAIEQRIAAGIDAALLELSRTPELTISPGDEA